VVVFSFGNQCLCAYMEIMDSYLSFQLDNVFFTIRLLLAA